MQNKQFADRYLQSGTGGVARVWLNLHRLFEHHPERARRTVGQKARVVAPTVVTRIGVYYLERKENNYATVKNNLKSNNF